MDAEQWVKLAKEITVDSDNVVHMPQQLMDTIETLLTQSQITKLTERVKELEDKLASLQEFIDKQLPQFDTNSPEAVRYHIAFHQSQQKKVKSKN